MKDINELNLPNAFRVKPILDHLSASFFTSPTAIFTKIDIKDESDSKEKEAAHTTYITSPF